MIFKLRNFHRFFFTYICPTFYGGAPSTPSNTTSNVTQNTIPKELMPYASGMLQAAKKQLYTTDDKGKITGYQPYKPFSTNANDYVAGFTPLQQQAQQGAANLQLPGQFGQATNLAQQAGNYSQLAQDPNAVAGFMSPYMQNVVDRQKMEANRAFGISGAQQMGQATRGGAFGGSREAIMAAENERNRQWKLSDIQASGTQNAFQNAQQNMQFGNQAQLASAQALGQLGEAQQGVNLNILNAQNAFGGQQQQQQQQAINQAVLNYQNEVNQPYIAAGTMSDLIRGTPMNNMTTMNYQAQPGFMQQAGTAAGTAASLYGAYKSGKKEGGIIDAYAEGGVTDVSAVSSYLDNLTIPQLHQLRNKSQSVENTKVIDEILARKEGGVQTAKNGGILGYADEKDKEYGSLVKNYINSEVKKEADNEKKYEGIKKVHGAIPEIVARSKDFYNSAVNDVKGIAVPLKDTIGNWAFAEDYNKPEPTPAPTTSKTPAAEAKEVAKGIAPLPTDKQSYNVPGGPLDTAQQSIVAQKAQPKTEAPAATPATPATSAPTPSGILTAQAPTQSAPTPFEAEAKKAMESDQETANMTTQQLMDKRKADMKAQGIQSSDDLAAEDRKRIMEEKNTAKDENKRQIYLRMAEFFSNWGSTPGAPLAAGLKAMKDTLPGFMEDNKQHHKLLRDLNKSESDLNRAVALEKRGDLNAAYSLKESASARLQKYNQVMYELSLKKQEADAKIKNDMDIARLQAQTSIANTNTTAAAHVSGVNASSALAKQSAAYDRAVDNAKKAIADDLTLLSLPLEERIRKEQQLTARYLNNDPLYAGKDVSNISSGDTIGSGPILKTKSGSPYTILSN
jgi:hypothetical protein